MTEHFVCPVCGFAGLKEPARDHRGQASEEICPSCGFQFGFDDDSEGITYDDWRTRWVDNGMTWWSAGERPPSDWNPERQLAQLQSTEAKRN